MPPESRMSDAPGTVLVTGATGLVGRHVAAELVRRGRRVRGAVRRPVTEAERVPGVEYVQTGDLGPDTDWSEALLGVDRVVHAAAHVHVMRPTSADDLAYRRVNVEGTLALAEQSARAGLPRLLFLSSIKVNGESTPQRAFTAADTPAPHDAFARCKHAAESGLRELAGRHGFECVIVRPPLVYGPGVRGNFGRLLHSVQRGIPLPFDSIDNRRSLVSVWNLADLVALALEHAAAPGKVWLVSDREDVSTPELIRRIARALRRPARLFRVPPALLTMAATLAGRRDEALRLTGSLYLDVGPTAELLGWRPLMSLDTGLSRTVAGMLPLEVASAR